MAMNIHPEMRCLFCARSTAPRRGGRRPRPPLRSYELSAQYIEANPHVQAYAHHRLRGHEVSIMILIACKCDLNLVPILQYMCEITFVQFHKLNTF